MINSRSRVAERILDLTLEILSLLIGEDYIIVKKRGDPVMCRRSHYESDGPPSPVPPPHSLIHERNNKQILELTDKMMSLLTGEVPVRCDDVTVYFSMEEWEYLEGHKELYRDVMMETHQPRGSPVAESACGDIFVNSGDCGNEEKRDLLQTDPQNVNIESATASESLEDMTGQSGRDAHTSQEPARWAPAHTSREDPADTLTEPAPADCAPSRIKEEAASRDDGDDTDGEADCRAVRIMEERRWDTGVKPFSCSECGDSFTESSALARHQRSHTREKPYSCSVCGKTFSCEFVLLTHQRIHTGDKPFACSECGKLFRQSSNLVIHQRVHTGEKPYSCCECGKRFTHSVCLQRHQSGRRGEKPYSCTECGKCFTMRTCFNVHRRIHMREKSQRIQAGEKPFSCSQCGKCFKCSSELIVHQRVHTGINPHPCPECGKRFRHRSSLVKHQRSHTGEKPYSCPECGKSFSHSSSLVKHRRDHTGEKPHSCSECGRSFSRSSSLTKHRITHTGEKPHLCSQCGKRFTQKSSLNKHRKIHVREESRL